ncbi:hypothetical protein Tco_1098471 [Tanacetum coccineum]
MRLWYSKGSGFALTAFSDADHASCVDTRKSTSGGIQILGDKLVSWMSKKQDCTAMSSAEAEYVALSASCAQGRMPTKIELTLEQSQQGVSNDVLSPTHYPCDSARTFRVILFSIHNDEWKSFQCHHQTYCSRIPKMEMVKLILAKSDSLPQLSSIYKEHSIKHQDSRIIESSRIKDKDSA